MSGPGGRRTLAEALVVNVCIVVAAGLAYLPMRLVTLLATAWAAAAVAVAIGLLLLARGRASRQAAEDWPFTFARANYVYALVVPPVLAGVAATVAFVHAKDTWGRGAEVTPAQVAMVLLVIGLAVVLQAWTAWMLFSTHRRLVEATPELPIALALVAVTTIGLGAAFLAVLTVVLTDLDGLDAIGSTAVGAVLVALGIMLLVMAGRVLVDRPLDAVTLERIRAAIEGAPGVDRVTAMKALEVGADQLMVAARFGVPASATAGEMASVTRGAVAALQAAEPRITHVFLEPDLFRVSFGAPRADATDLDGTAIDADWLKRLVEPETPEDPAPAPA